MRCDRQQIVQEKGVALSLYRNRHSLASKIKRVLWSFVYAILFRPMPRSCAMGWKRLILRAFGAKIGKGVRIESSAQVWAPWNLTVGEDSWIGGGARIYSVDKLVIGSNSVVSQDAFVCTASHDIASRLFELKTRPVIIGDNSWVADSAIVLPGVTIGDGSVVAAGSVVVGDVESWTVVGGNPAVRIKDRVLA